MSRRKEQVLKKGLAITAGVPAIPFRNNVPICLVKHSSLHAFETADIGLPLHERARQHQDLELNFILPARGGTGLNSTTDPFSFFGREIITIPAAVEENELMTNKWEEWRYRFV